MNKILVVYQSNYGYTKIYAEMIAEALNCEVQEASLVSSDRLSRYDTIIYGGGLYASSINGIKFIHQNYSSLAQKNLIIWATGLMSYNPSDEQTLWAHNFSPTMQKNLHTFYMRGGLDYQRLSFGHKLMINALKLMLKKKKNRSAEEEALLQSYDTPQNYCDRKNIAPLLAYVKSL